MEGTIYNFTFKKIFIIFLIFWFLTRFIFIIKDGTAAVITTFGKVHRTAKPGINIIIPFVQQYHVYDVKTQVIPEKFDTLTKDIQLIQATATVKYAINNKRVENIYKNVTYYNKEIYKKMIKPSLLKSLKSVFSKYELDEINVAWEIISQKIQKQLIDEIKNFQKNIDNNDKGTDDYIIIQDLDLTGLKIAEEYREAIEQKKIAEQIKLKAKTEVEIAELEAEKYEKLEKELTDKVLYKLFLDKWDGQTQVVPGVPGSSDKSPSVIVNSNQNKL
jgi:prohibitin 2